MLPDINLLPEYERENSFLYILFWIGLIISFILFGVLGYFYFTEKNSMKETDSLLQELYDEKSQLEEQLAALTTEEETDSIVNAATFIENHLIPTSAFIDELITLLPENGYLSNYNYTYQSVDIETQFETMGEAADYVSALLASNYVKDAMINEIYTFELSSEENEAGENEEEMFNVIPRYNVSYTIDVDQSFMREAGGGNE